MKWFFAILLPSISLTLASSIWAASPLKQLEPQKRSQVIQLLSDKLAVDFSEAQVFPSDLPGYYLINIQGDLIFVSHDLKHLINGEVIDINNGVNLSAAIKQQSLLNVLNALGSDQAITFKSIGKTLATLTIFTDIDCGYCRKLHQEISTLNNAGITVKYFAFPRSGPNTESWYKAERSWCAEDAQNTLTAAKQGLSIKSSQQRSSCSVDIAAQYTAGKKLGITGTPTLILETGETIPGYIPAARLIPRLLATSSR